MQTKTVHDLRLEKAEHQETLAMKAAFDVIKQNHLEGDFQSRLRLIAIQEHEYDLANSLATATRGESLLKV